MRRASYREAIRWIALNDDTAWLDEDEWINGQPCPSVSAVLIADLFDVPVERVIRDIQRHFAPAGAYDRHIGER